MASLGKARASPLPTSLPSSEVTHVVMEQTSAEDAVCWLESRTAPLPPGCAHPALLDISWFTESMAAGQPVPVECRHRLEVSWAVDSCGATGKAPMQAVVQLGQLTWQQCLCPDEVGSEGSAHTSKPVHPSFCCHHWCRLLGSTYFWHLLAFLVHQVADCDP